MEQANHSRYDRQTEAQVCRRTAGCEIGSIGRSLSLRLGGSGDGAASAGARANPSFAGIAPHPLAEPKRSHGGGRGGRPSKYSANLADQICLAIATSPKGLHAILRDDPTLPAQRTVYDWLKAFPAFAQQYARARQQQAELVAGETIEIADDSSRDYVTRNGEPIVDQDHVQRCRLRIDTRKWMASKLLPRVYGERRQVDVTGELSLRALVAESYALQDVESDQQALEEQAPDTSDADEWQP
jgi:hypothetical protein